MKWAFLIFVSIYAVAAGLLLVGTFGWLGQGKDPMSAVFLLPLGLPWNWLADRIGLPGMIALVLSPAVNAGILFWLWKRKFIIQ